MLKELKFVQGAISKKDFIPALTHFQIHKGRVSAFNGKLALSSPISCDLDCKPKGFPLVAAIMRCEDAIQLSMTPTGRLSIKSGGFRANIECIAEDMPDMQPEGERVDFDGQSLLEAFEAVFPFIGNDASRNWTNGVLLRDNSAYATNNVCLVQYWLGTANFPHVVNVPRNAIAEIIRIHEAPTHAQVSEHSMTFHYSDGRWIRTQLYATEWPDLGRVLNVSSDNAHPTDRRIFEGINYLKPFVDKLGRVFLEGITMRTHEGIEEGATWELDSTISALSCYNIEMLALLEDVAEYMDMSRYPEHNMFFGHEGKLRGAIIGMRL